MVMKRFPHKINIVRDNTAYEDGEYTETTEVLAEDIPCYLQLKKSALKHNNSVSSNERNWKTFCDNLSVGVKVGDKIAPVLCPLSFKTAVVTSAVDMQTHLEIECRC